MNIPITGQIYTHYKDPTKQYEIVGIALHTETEEEMVVYKPLYKNEHQFFVRPLTMFIEKVEFQGKTVSRFSLRD